MRFAPSLLFKPERDAPAKGGSVLPLCNADAKTPSRTDASTFRERAVLIARRAIKFESLIEQRAENENPEAPWVIHEQPRKSGPGREDWLHGASTPGLHLGPQPVHQPLRLRIVGRD